MEKKKLYLEYLEYIKEEMKRFEDLAWRQIQELYEFQEEYKEEEIDYDLCKENIWNDYKNNIISLQWRAIDRGCREEDLAFLGL